MKNKALTLLFILSQVFSTVALMSTIISFTTPLINFSLFMKIAFVCCIANIVILIASIFTYFKDREK